MTSPAEAKDPKSKDSGCSWLIIRIVFFVAVIFVIDYLAAFIFEAAVPHDEITADLVPFQNHYLATTDAFVTSEGMKTEFSLDPGPGVRFLNFCIFPFIGIMILSIIIYAIPYTKKLADYTLHLIIASFVLVMIDAMFFPPVMTVFDRERKMMIIHRPEWIFFGSKTEIPFSDISGFTYSIEKDLGDIHTDDVIYGDIFALTTNGKIFIGENELDAHPATSDDIPVPKSRVREVERAVAALHKLIGK